MNETIRLGRIAGVSVGLNWTLAGIFLLVAFGLALGRFPLLYPGYASGAYLAAGGAAALLLFASILAHELGHAVVARRNGIEVEGITLWLFGGVAKLSGEARSPGAELRIAGVGPVVSVAVAIAAGLSAGILEAAGADTLLVGTLRWLALINVILAVFNLVPAAPLDGGRILRAFLWHRSGDPAASAVTAARAGRTFGFFLIAFGLLNFVAGAGIAGLWLVLIGWFLVNAARAEEEAAQLKGTLGDLRAHQVMTADPVLVDPRLSVAEMVDDYVFRHRFSSFPVGRSPEAVEGLVTLGRLKGVPTDRRRTTLVGDLAVPLDQVAVSADDPVPDILVRLDGGLRALVFDGGRLVGIVSPADIVHTMSVAGFRPRNGDRQLA